eukprot:5773289-Amphidinium_carterae.1
MSDGASSSMGLAALDTDDTVHYETDHTDLVGLPMRKRVSGSRRRWVSAGNDRVKSRLAKPIFLFKFISSNARKSVHRAQGANGFR